MSTLSYVLKKSQAVPFNKSSKIAIMSDCHRGIGSHNDNFLKNRHIFVAALTYYLQNDFTYIELGDGEELWENRSIDEIKDAHKDIYELMRLFEEQKSLYVVYGNHDMKKCCRSLGLENTKCREGLILRGLGREIFLVHGHQSDLLNDYLWRLARFLTRYVWAPLEAIGIRNPTSPAKNFKKKTSVEKRISAWCEKHKQMTICGHTHRPVMPLPGEGVYFNCGSSIHPYAVTAIEIVDGYFFLVKWMVKTDSLNSLYVEKEGLGGPYDITLYL